MKALVTGGLGFIGSHLVEALIASHNEVVILDNESSGRLQNLSGLHNQYSLIPGDIRSPEDLNQAIQGVDTVYHLAALTSVPQSLTEPILTHDVNVTGSLQVLKTALDAGVRRVVLASSCSVYGDLSTPPLKETLLPQPKSPYAMSKLMMENLAQGFYQSYGLETVSLRFFNVYGPRQLPDSDYAAVIPKFINCYQQGRIPLVYGDGKQSRDFIHVRDIVAALMRASSVSMNQNQQAVFNVGTGQQLSIIDLLQQIASQANWLVKPSFQEARQGDIQASYADVSNAQNKLGFTAQINIENGLKELLQQASLTLQSNSVN